MLPVPEVLLPEVAVAPAVAVALLGDDPVALVVAEVLILGAVALRNGSPELLDLYWKDKQFTIRIIIHINLCRE